MFELWMKNQKVLSYKEEGGVPTAVKVDQQELLPVSFGKACTPEMLGEWLKKRAIPEQREGLNDVISEFGDNWKFCKNKASLTDQYWIKCRDEEWRKVNFFTNIYSTDIGDVFFTPWKVTKRKLNTMSPDMVTNGVLKKRWKQKPDKSSYLVKAGSIQTQQEPLSEILVSILLEELDFIPYVRYDYHVEGVTLCSRCDNFVTQNTELITAADFYNLIPRDKTNETVYNHLLKMCDYMEIEGAEDFLQKMIFVDYLTGNTDRNLGNIGFLRDINTFKITPAPIFDSGAAYWSKENIDNAVHSKLFGDIEKKIMLNMREKYNLKKMLKNEKYYDCISSYPCITAEKKKDLIEAIKDRNRTLLAKTTREIQAER